MIRTLTATRGRLATTAAGGTMASTRPFSQQIRMMEADLAAANSSSSSSHPRNTSRSSSPMPRLGAHSRTQNNVVVAMSPRAVQRSYGTAPQFANNNTTTILETTFLTGGTTHENPVRHSLYYHSLHEASPIPSTTTTSHREDYDEWNALHGYVVEAATTATASEPLLSTTAAPAATASIAATTTTTCTTDMDMDVVSDDEEWVPSLSPLSSAEQVLAMMNTSYYHASYQAKSRSSSSSISD